MGPAKIFLRIRNDHTYLLKVYLYDLLAQVSFILLLFTYPIPKFNPQGPVSTLAILVLAIFFGWVVSSFIHNTSHGNIKPAWLNRLIGEFCGYWVMYGFSNFVLIHRLHHMYPDEERDPVSPKGMRFVVFLSAPMRYMIRRAKVTLFELHGNKMHYGKIMLAQHVLLKLNLGLRLVFWYALLGPQLFALFYLTGLMSNIAILAHINYVSHRNRDDGAVEVVNINHNLYYKVANFFTIGGYFHKNHHLNVKLFNPMKLRSPLVEVEMLTIKPNRQSGPGSEYRSTVLGKYFKLNDVWGEGEANRLVMVSARSDSKRYPTSASGR